MREPAALPAARTTAAAVDEEAGLEEPPALTHDERDQREDRHQRGYRGEPPCPSARMLTPTRLTAGSPLIEIHRPGGRA